MSNQKINNYFCKRKIIVLVVLIFGLIVSSSFFNIHNPIKLEASSNFCDDNISIAADEPNITASHNFWYIEGFTGNSITWNITDFTVNNPTYYVERNSIEVVANQSWTSGENITLVVDGLTPDVYNYTIVYTDGIGEIYTNTILVTVIANEDPTITGPEDIFLTIDNSSWYIAWSIYDFTYVNLTSEIFVNGTSSGVNNLANSTNNGIVLGIFLSSLGSYNYTIVVKDGLGGISNDTVWVFVLPVASSSIPPTTVISSFTGGILSLTMLITVSIAVVSLYKRRKKQIQWVS